MCVPYLYMSIYAGKDATERTRRQKSVLSSREFNRNNNESSRALLENRIGPNKQPGRTKENNVDVGVERPLRSEKYERFNKK